MVYTHICICVFLLSWQRPGWDIDAHGQRQPEVAAIGGVTLGDLRAGWNSNPRTHIYRVVHRTRGLKDRPLEWRCKLFWDVLWFVLFLVAVGDVVFLGV